jgi:hypothetical protein
MLGYINGNKIRPIFEAQAKELDMYDSQVMILITNSLEPQLLESFCYLETAAEL